MGVELGSSMMPAKEDENDKGFWEDLDIYRFNEKVLSKAQSSWHKLAPLNSSLLEGPEFSAERREGAALLSLKLAQYGADSKVFGFKDPRTAVVLPLWRCIFQDLDLDDRYIITVRNPLDTAASLQARDQFPMTKGVLLWAKHVLQAVRYSQGRPRVFVSYDKVLEDPIAELQRISTALALPEPRQDDEGVQEYTNAFLSKDLRRHHTGKGELARSGLAPQFLLDIENIISNLTRQGADAQKVNPLETETWDELERQFLQIAPVLDYADSIEDHRAKANRAVQTAESKLQETTKALEASQTQRQAAEKAAEEQLVDLKARHAEELASVIEKKEQEESKLRRIVRDNQDAENSQKEQIESLRNLHHEEIRALEEKTAAIRTKLDAQQQNYESDLTAHADRIQELSDERDELVTRFEEVHARLRSKELSNNAEIGALLEQKSDLERELQQTKAEFDNLKNALVAKISQRDLRIQSLTADYSAITERYETLANELSSLAVESSAEIGALIDEKRQLASALEAAKTKNSKSTQQAVEAQKALSEKNQALSTELKEKSAALAQAQHSLEKRDQEHSQDRARLVAEIARLASEGEAARNFYAEQTKELTKQHQTALSAMEQSARAKEQASQAALDKLSQQRDAEATKAKSIQRSYAESASRAEQLTQDLQAKRRNALLARAEVNEIRRSLSWKITSPLRAIGRLVRNPVGTTKEFGARAARAAWQRVPLAPATRGKLAGAAFSTMPFFFSWTEPYKAWRAEQKARPYSPQKAPVGSLLLEAPTDPTLDGPVPLTALTPPASVKVRAIASYLPQFHAIPENDAWWGEGFTEWTKVRAAQPLFDGHYQPREPGELGYYDLISDPSVMERQAELAALHGLSGFCFYFYWFAGKRLLETPLLNYLKNEKIEFPFCLCWANENWSRRWDGREQDILISQDHSPADDIAFISHVAQYLNDPRYIRIEGRPLLVVYRPELLPSPKETALRWRTWARENGIGEIFLASTHAFENTPPSDHGFDAAIEFPPNNCGLDPEPDLAERSVSSRDLKLYDWRKLAGQSQSYKDPGFKLFRGVTTDWDNTARRPKDGAVFLNATPTSYQLWLENAVDDTCQRFDSADERVVFINAWNEWAEGTYLEPDAKHGYAWLEATRRALTGGQISQKKKILVVTHDLHPHGAQLLSLNLLKTLKNRFGFQVACISCGPGPLASDFETLGTLEIVDAQSGDPVELRAIIARYKAQNFRAAIINSAASGWIAPYLFEHDIEMVALVHELPSIIKAMKLEDPLRSFDKYANTVVFPAQFVRDRALQSAGLAQWRNASIRPQGLYKSDSISSLDEKHRALASIRTKLALPSNAEIVLGVGYADRRKGPDTFVRWAIAAVRKWPHLHFVWLGKMSPEMDNDIAELLSNAGQARKHIHFLGFTDHTAEYYKAASLYALTSREDPFPSTALESLNAATPVAMIGGTGGIEDLAGQKIIVSLDSDQPDDFIQSAEALVENRAEREEMGLRGLTYMNENFGFASYVGSLLDHLPVSVPNVSVIVPNYNYAHHLTDRIRSILAQTIPPREIIILDDASSDNSIEVAEELLRDCGINWKIVRNTKNSGSVFKQWEKGVSIAKGELVWIAEADDCADPRFLEVATRHFLHESIVVSFTESKQIDEHGTVLANSYIDYVRDISSEKWGSEYINSGQKELQSALCIKNTIPNVSGAVFRADPLRETLSANMAEITSFRVAGDWCVYVHLLQKGDIAFSPEPLNHHRRHSESVTIQRFGLPELSEISRMQRHVSAKFPVSAEARRKANSYLKNLVQHFSLEETSDPNELRQALGDINAVK